MAPLLELKELTVRFGGLTAVSKVNLQMEPGEVLSLIGPNGAGKTTVFNAITGLSPITSGEILLNGTPLARPLTNNTLLLFVGVGLVTGLLATTVINIETLWQETIVNHFVYRKPFPWSAALTSLRDFYLQGALLLPFALSSVVGSCGAFAVWSRFRASPDVVASFGVLRTFQNIRLFRRMSVLENVLLGMESTLRSRFWGAVFRTKRYRHEEEVAREKARELLAFVGLSAEEGIQAESLSYGAQRRLEIARALASDPKLLLLDEPAAGMNPAETAALGELIHRIRARGVSLLLIEHHMNVVMKLSDRIVVLEYGNKIAEGTPEEIQRSERVIEAYLGKSS